MRAVTSTYRLIMKFPTENGVGTIKGNQFKARTCNVAATCGKEAKDMVASILRAEDSLSIEMKKIEPLAELDPRREVEGCNDELSVNEIHIRLV